MTRFPCTYLHGEVELTDEREGHIAENHPDLLPEHLEQIVETLADPDEVRRSLRSRNARLFSRWFEAVRGGKHVVVVVVSQPGPTARRWIVTAYITTGLAEGETEWKRG